MIIGFSLITMNSSIPSLSQESLELCIVDILIPEKAKSWLPLKLANVSM